MFYIDLLAACRCCVLAFADCRYLRFISSLSWLQNGCLNVKFEHHSASGTYNLTVCSAGAMRLEQVMMKVFFLWWLPCCICCCYELAFADCQYLRFISSLSWLQIGRLNVKFEPHSAGSTYNLTVYSAAVMRLRQVLMGGMHQGGEAR